MPWDPPSYLLCDELAARLADPYKNAELEASLWLGAQIRTLANAIMALSEDRADEAIEILRRLDSYIRAD